jgi:hypothetical protein
MDTAIIIIIALRLLFPLLIFRWNLAGALLAIFMDAIDYPILSIAQSPYFTGYQDIDKIFDFYYLSLEAVTVLRWGTVPIKKLLFSLFAFRALGVIAFEIMNIRYLLFFFPNVFEYVYLYALFIKHIKKNEVHIDRTFTYVVVGITLVKLVQEYVLHFGQVEYWRWIFN